MIYECMYFYNELDILDLKLHELNDVVDYFLVAEYPTNLDGSPQRMYYQENKDRFSDFNHKIIHVTGTGNEPNITGFGLYAHRFGNYEPALAHCKPNDIIISSDPDVVLKKEKVIEIAESNMENHDTQPVMDWYCFYMDYKCNHIKYGFNGASLYKNTLVHSWTTMKRFKPVGTVVTDAGWHFSKMGGVDMVLNHIQGYPHQDLKTKANTDREAMLVKMERGLAWDSDITTNPPRVLDHIPYDPKNYPEYLNQHPEIYAKYFKGGMNA